VGALSGERTRLVTIPTGPTPAADALEVKCGLANDVTKPQCVTGLGAGVKTEAKLNFNRDLRMRLAFHMSICRQLSSVDACREC
jgi:hypothetical protein